MAVVSISSRRSKWPSRITIEANMKMHTEAARALGVSRKTLSAIVNGRAGISPEMAVRLSIAFNTSAESWLNQQLQYDLWRAEKKRKRLHVARLTAA